VVELVSQAVVDMLGYSTWRRELVIDLWLRNTLANGHTDLIYFERCRQPEMFFFSPFLTRPLGISLPSILSHCPCKTEQPKDASMHEDRQGDKKGVRKVWKVAHTGKMQMPLGQVQIKLLCSCCKRIWKIQKPDLKGVLWKSGGLHASVVQYFD
jgi:hypothetical protein